MSGGTVLGETLLGLDIGTSSLKAALFDLTGKLVAEASAEYQTASPHAGWAEQSPLDWWRAAQKVIPQVLGYVPHGAASVCSIGLAGHTPTQVLVDARGEAIGPAILWQDRRAVAEARWLRNEIGPEQMRVYLGMELPLEASYTPARLLWTARKRPADLARTYRILQPKDYLGLKLTGEFFSDVWSSKGLVHVPDGRVIESYLDRLGIRHSVAPNCQAPWAGAGEVSREAARLTGLKEGTPVTTGWSDALCGMLGTGVLEKPGLGFVLTGTSEVIGLSCQNGSKTGGLLRIPCEISAGVDIVFGPTQAGGGALEWARRTVYPNLSVHEFVEKAVRARSGVVFLPYLDGERAPIWNPTASGAFLGVSGSDGAGELARAVLEGVAFSNRHVLEIAERSVGHRTTSVRISGRSATLGGWNQIRADALGLPLESTEVEGTTALGAAMLAAVACGMHASASDASRAMVRIHKTFRANTGVSAAYGDRYAAYRAAHRSLESVFGRLSRLGSFEQERDARGHPRRDLHGGEPQERPKREQRRIQSQ